MLIHKVTTKSQMLCRFFEMISLSIIFRQKEKKCRFVALHLTNYLFVQSRHPQAILQAV